MTLNASRRLMLTLFLLVTTQSGFAQTAPYDVFPEAKPPYYRVRYEASTKPGELSFAVNYTTWIPPGVKQLRGVVVHQHGCGEGSCKSGLTGAFDLHWQALAAKHDCALLAPAYEQPQAAECQLWCDPRNGSAAAFLKCLEDLGKASAHPELSTVPWALWGHSGGGHWVGGIVMLYPERVIAAWLRSGVPLLIEDPSQTRIRAHEMPEAALAVPMVCNLGTKEGYSIKEANFSGVWPANEKFFRAIRSKGGLIGVAIDPKSSHDCGNQRYLAIPWLDACMSLRLGDASGKLRSLAAHPAWLADHAKIEIESAAKWPSDKLEASWLPTESIAQAWKQYSTDTEIQDTTPPPAPSDLVIKDGSLSWSARADLESGLAKFLIYRDGQLIATIPEKGQNPHGRPLFQGLSYSDTPNQPLAKMTFTDLQPSNGTAAKYNVVSVNTVGLESPK